MNKFIIGASVFILGTFLGGCSSVTDVFTKPTPAFLSVSDANEQINKAKVCCEGDIFNGKVFNVTKTIDEEFLIDADNAQAFNFPTGKSFFRIFQLPLNATYLNITMESLIITTTFKPRVDFYNKNHQLVSTLKPIAFKYRDSMMGEGKLMARITINNASAEQGREFAYMVIYTTDEARTETTSVVHPAVKQAKALRNNVPDMPNLQIPHSPIGTLNIAFKFKRDEKDFTDELLEYLDNPLIGGKDTNNRQENVVLANGTVYSTSSQSEGTTAVKSVDSKGNILDPDNSNKGSSHVQSAPVGSMLKESEDMYNKLIIQAIKENDVAKAMNLVSEAQRAGSSSAQQTFVDAIQSIKR